MSQETVGGDVRADGPELDGAGIDGGALVALRDWLPGRPVWEVADALARLPPGREVVLFRLLEKDRALAVFEELHPVDQHRLVHDLADEDVHRLVAGMDPDDRAAMLGEAPAGVVAKALDGLAPRERRATAALLGYPRDSVGRVMTPRVLALSVALDAATALRHVRDHGRGAETVHTLPVIDAGRRLVGTVELADLVLEDGATPVADLVDGAAPRVPASEEAERAARLMGQANLFALCVVDSEERLLGVLSLDDAVELLEAAESEDVARQSGASPWAGLYMGLRVWTLARSRVVWLLVLLVAATLTVNVLQYFEDALEQVTALALFVPLLVGAGGNAGAQAATAAVRALAVGEVRPADVLRVAWRECRVGLCLGVVLAVLGFVIASLLVDPSVALVLAVSLVIVCAWAATVGATMPLLARRAGIDPAVVSAPMVTTLVDATGLLIYFLVAGAVLGL